MKRTNCLGKRIKKTGRLSAVFFFTISILVSSSYVYASGGRLGNGGDECEKRIENIKIDIREWVNKNGGRYLDFKKMLNHRKYKNLMLRDIEKPIISCTTEKIFIGSSQKTCRNYVDSEGIKRVECNIERFLKFTDEARQYTLIHHEFAGVAGIETNNGLEKSDYFLSNQISGYLQNFTIKKLVIRKKRKPVKIVNSKFCKNKYNKEYWIHANFAKEIKENIVASKSSLRERLDGIERFGSEPENANLLQIILNQTKEGETWNYKLNRLCGKLDLESRFRSIDCESENFIMKKLGFLELYYSYLHRVEIKVSSDDIQVVVCENRPDYAPYDPDNRFYMTLCTSKSLFNKHALSFTTSVSVARKPGYTVEGTYEFDVNSSSHEYAQRRMKKLYPICVK